MLPEEIKKRLIANDALFRNIFVFEQQFDILPDGKHIGAAIAYQDLNELRESFLGELIDTLVDWVYSSEKYADLLQKAMATGKSQSAASSEIRRRAAQKFRKSEDTLLIQGQLGAVQFKDPTPDGIGSLFTFPLYSTTVLLVAFGL